MFAARHPEAIVLGQSAVGINPRSAPATYTRIWDTMRKLLAQQHGVDPGLFNFNAQGVCPECKGRGTITTDLAFLDPVTTICEVCGRCRCRYRDEVLGFELESLNVVDILGLTVADALGFSPNGALRGAWPRWIGSVWAI
ncbi:hypothetical protein [Streptomyces sp. NPDC048639]|uniref:hypothetical protein n=1 Tax=Streptomyces sp. NPDC048639 TaxID=3365581 RepID=UPI00371E0336